MTIKTAVSFIFRMLLHILMLPFAFAFGLGFVAFRLVTLFAAYAFGISAVGGILMLVVMWSDISVGILSFTILISALISSGLFVLAGFLKNLEARRAGNSHGSAGFGHAKDSGLATSQGCIIARQNNNLLRFDQEGHLLTFAPTGTGKGVSQVIPNLLTYPGSIVCIDIKGENSVITGRHRRTFGPVYTLDPFNLRGQTARFNPLDTVRINTPAARDDAKAIAIALVPNTEDHRERFWTSSAQNLLTATILWVCMGGTDGPRDLSAVRRLLTANSSEWAGLFDAMRNDEEPVLQEFGSRYAGMVNDDPKLWQNVLSTAIEATDFLASRSVQSMMSASDFSWEDLKRKTFSVFLVIPPEHLKAFAPFLRLAITLATGALSRVPDKPQLPVLFLLDEFPALGPLEAVKDAIAYARGYGGKFWLFVQDLGQLQALYGDAARSFIANCRCKTAFAVSDIETAREISAMLGKKTIVTESHSKTKDPGKWLATTGTTTSETSRDLITPDELLRLPPSEVLVFITGARPILATQVRYFNDNRFNGLWDKLL